MGGNKILIVDDEPFILETIKFSLELEGFKCLTAQDGMEAVKISREEEPDIILLDVVLPKIDGYKVCRMLKSDDRFRDTPIIMMSARDYKRDRKSGYESGADEYIIKPIDMDGLPRLLRSYLRKKED